MIRLHNIHVHFARGSALEKKALQGIDLQLGEGEFVTVIGSNGAGKSTLLNTISGEMPASTGSLFIDAKDVNTLPSYARADAVARVFQDPLAGTCGDLTIAENLALAHRRGKSRGLTRSLPRRLKDELKIALAGLNLGLENRLDTPMSLLSGGQRQAVSLLMATLGPLKILLLDEHTAALDPKTAAYILELTQAIVTDKGLTTLMVTHSLQQALHYGSRTIMLHEGRIIFDVRGAERAKLTVADLLRQFGEAIDDDALLLQGTAAH